MKQLFPIALLLLISCHSSELEEEISMAKFNTTDYYSFSDSTFIIQKDALQFLQTDSLAYNESQLLIQWMQIFMDDFDTMTTHLQDPERPIDGYPVILDTQDETSVNSKTYFKDMNNDGSDELIWLLGKEESWAQLMFICQESDSAYKMMRYETLSSRRGDPEIEFYPVADNEFLLYAFHGGWAYPGASYAHHEFYRFVRDSVVHVLSIPEYSESTQSIGSSVVFDILSPKGEDEIRTRIYYKYWLACDLDIASSIMPGTDGVPSNWKSGEFNLNPIKHINLNRQWFDICTEAGSFYDAKHILLQDSLDITFNWIPRWKEYSNLKHDYSDELLVLTSQNLSSEGYERKFFKAFRDEIHATLDTSSVERIKTIEFMEHVHSNQSIYPELNMLLGEFTYIFTSEVYDQLCLNTYKEEYGPGFNPSIVASDFNGDGKEDYIVACYDQVYEYIIGFVSDGNNWNKQVLLEGALGAYSEFPRGLILCNALKGNYESPYEENGIELVNDGFKMIFCEKAAILFYWEEGEFKEFTLSD